ncbi:MAG: DOMON-like domain-containing protein [Azonexus sp.]
MILHPLHCHPDDTPPPDLAVGVQAARTPTGDLRLIYRIQGAQHLLVPPPSPAPGPRDNLWQHTCCEAFIGAARDTTDAAYLEFNFSPSGDWAAYEFTAYRERNARWQTSAAPHIGTGQSAAGFLLTAEIPRALLPAAPWRLGLTFVAEAQDAGKSHWALAHAASRPDFHLAASFTLLLP